MFTGLIEEVGTVERAGARLEISTGLRDLRVGASVAVDGACLTVVEHGGGRCAFDVSAETMRRTTLGERKPGDRVNLELPLALGARLGGHLVLGHVDGVGTLVEKSASGRLLVELPKALLPLVVEKGSIALDGISLTVNELRDPAIVLQLIPETLRATTWGGKQPGARVNVEADILGKHVARLLGRRSGIDAALLERAGFIEGSEP